MVGSFTVENKWEQNIKWSTRMIDNLKHNSAILAIKQSVYKQMDMAVSNKTILQKGGCG